MAATTRREKVPSHLHHTPSGRGRVRLNGRDFYTGPWGTVEANDEYNRLVKAWVKNGRHIPGQASADEALSIEALVFEYVTHAERTLSKARFKGNVMPAVRRLLAGFGPMRAADFGGRQLRQFRRGLIDERGADGSRLTRQYINDVVSLIKTVFAWAASDERELVPTAVHHSLSLVKHLKYGEEDIPEAVPVKPVADEVVNTTLPHLPATVADMVRIQRLTGTRPAEVCGMRWADIDQSGETWTYCPKHHKTERWGHKREVPIGPKAQAILMKYRTRPVDAAIFAPAESVRKHHAEFRSRRVTELTEALPDLKGRERERALGLLSHFAATPLTSQPSRVFRQRYTTAAYGRAIARAVKVAYRPAAMTDAEFEQWKCPQHWAPNQLRHTAGTVARATYGLEAASALLGHANLDTTLIYAERKQGLAARVARDVG